MRGKNNSALKASSTPVETKPEFVPLSEKELDKFKVGSFDQLLPKFQIAALLLQELPQAPQVQKARRTIESSIELLQTEAAA